MQRSRQQKFAVGAFNIDNQETLIAIARAAQKLNSPVLVRGKPRRSRRHGLMKTYATWLITTKMNMV